MEMIVAVIKPYQLEEVRDAVLQNDINGMTISEVKGFGRQKGHHELYKGAEYKLDFIPKIMITILAPDDRVKRIKQDITVAASTGKIGDGVVWSVPIDSYTRIRTSEVITDESY